MAGNLRTPSGDRCGFGDVDAIRPLFTRRHRSSALPRSSCSSGSSSAWASIRRAAVLEEVLYDADRIRWLFGPVPPGEMATESLAVGRPLLLEQRHRPGSDVDPTAASGRAGSWPTGRQRADAYPPASTTTTGSGRNRVVLAALRAAGAESPVLDVGCGPEPCAICGSTASVPADIAMYEPIVPPPA
jgi:hypothetical protein